MSSFADDGGTLTVEAYGSAGGSGSASQSHASLLHAHPELGDDDGLLTMTSSYGATGANQPSFPLGADDDPERGEHSAPVPLPFRQDLLWTSLAFSFFAFLCGTLLAFTLSGRFQRFVVQNANALFTIPYVISFIVILACLAPWVPSSASSLNQMNAGVIASVSDFLLILLVLVEWATCLALMLVTLVAVHEGLSYISVDGLIVPRGDGAAPARGTQPDPAVGGIPRNSPIILAVPLLTLYSLFNVLIHLYSCIESLIRRRRGLVDSDLGPE